MSYQEAVEDRIPMRCLSNGVRGYMPPCHICGSPTSSWNYVRSYKYTCKSCKKAGLPKKVCTQVHKNSH